MPRCFKILRSAPRRLGHVFAALWEFDGKIAVVVPIAVIELDETHAAFGQAARQQTVGGKRAGLLRVFSIEFESAGRLLGEIGQVGHGSLHAERHFVLGDAGVGFGIAEFFVFELVQLAERIEIGAAVSLSEALGVGDDRARGRPTERNFTP